MVTISYTEARAHLAELLDRAVRDRESIIITRRRGEAVAFIAADELAGLLETVHLLRSPANADRLLAALARAKVRVETPIPLDALKAELGLDAE